MEITAALVCLSVAVWSGSYLFHLVPLSFDTGVTWPWWGFAWLLTAPLLASFIGLVAGALVCIVWTWVEERL